MPLVPDADYLRLRRQRMIRWALGGGVVALLLWLLRLAYSAARHGKGADAATAAAAAGAAGLALGHAAAGTGTAQLLLRSAGAPAGAAASSGWGLSGELGLQWCIVSPAHDTVGCDAGKLGVLLAVASLAAGFGLGHRAGEAAKARERALLTLGDVDGTQQQEHADSGASAAAVPVASTGNALTSGSVSSNGNGLLVTDTSFDARVGGMGYEHGVGSGTTHNNPVLAYGFGGMPVPSTVAGVATPTALSASAAAPAPAPAAILGADYLKL
jgi:hypothetical protein